MISAQPGAMRRSRRWLAAVVAGAVLLPVGAVLAAGSASAVDQTVTFTKTSDWGAGFVGTYTIRNTASEALDGWELEFDMPSGTSVGSYWEALLTSSGSHHTFTNREYNGTVPAGGSVSFGFIGSGEGSPANCTLNGDPCASDSSSTTTPSTSPSRSPSASSSPSVSPTGSVSSSPQTSPRTSPTISRTSPPAGTAPAETGLPKHALVGYLHASFANGSGYIRMKDVPDTWDIINLSFAEPTSPTSGQVQFGLCPVGECPGVESEAEFIDAIKEKQAQGKKVLISIGGANGQVRLTNEAARDAFVSSVSEIIDKYGLDGLDVDFEGNSLSLNSGDADFKNPTTPVVVNLISALKTLKGKYGQRFVLTMAPETFFVQLGYQFYGGSSNGAADQRAGAYLPVIYAMREDLTLLHVQDYNSGPIMGLDDKNHFIGNADFHIAMTDMILAGFPIQGDEDRFFPALRQDQVAIGLPSSTSAGNGFTTVAEVQKALDCLTKGQSCGTYSPRGTYPDLRGLMTWSINWDRFNKSEFSNSHSEYFDALS